MLAEPRQVRLKRSSTTLPMLAELRQSVFENQPKPSPDKAAQKSRQSEEKAQIKFKNMRFQGPIFGVISRP